MTGQTALTIQALCEFALFDLINRYLGFRGVRDLVARGRSRLGRRRGLSSAEILRSVNRAMCLYFKPVACLQESVATARLLRRYGIACELVIAGRILPFVGHAFVEVEGTVTGPPGYAKRLKVLTRL